jgi:hypothetical protein
LQDGSLLLQLLLFKEVKCAAFWVIIKLCNAEVQLQCHPAVLQNLQARLQLSKLQTRRYEIHISYHTANEVTATLRREPRWSSVSVFAKPAIRAGSAPRRPR